MCATLAYNARFERYVLSIERMLKHPILLRFHASITSYRDYG